MARSTTIQVSILADVKRFQDALGQARRDAQTLGQRTKDAFREVGTAGNAIRTAGVLIAFSSMKNAASDLQQAVGGTSAVFGEMSSIIDTAAADSANSVGLSERAFREATSRIGAGLKGLGFNQRAAAQESIRLTQIGADLAATFGGDVTQAVDAISAGLRGEMDPLERYGIALNDATLKAKAMELGLYSGTGQLEQNAKAQAVLALVTERSAGALGQFAREADTEAGKQQRAMAAMENAQASMGRALLPVYTQIYGAVARIAGVFALLPAPAQTMLVALIGVVGLAGPMMKMAEAVKATGLALRAFAVAHPYITAFVAAATIAAVIIGRNADKARQAREEMLGYARAMQEAGDAASGATNQIAEMARETPELADLMAKAGVTAGDLGAALAGSEQDWRAMRDQLLATAEAQGVGGLALEALTAGLDRQRTAAQAAIPHMEDVAAVTADVEQVSAEAAEAIEREGNAFGRAADEARRAADRVDDYIDAQRRMVDPLFNMTEAQRELTEAQEKYNEVMSDSEATEADRAEALEEVIQATYDLDAAALRLATDVRTGAVSQREATRRLEEWVAQGLITQTQADRMRQAFQDAAREANNLAGQRAVTFTSNIEEQLAKLREYNANLRTINGTVARTVVGPGGGAAFHARGGLVGMHPGSPRGTDTVPAWLTPGEFVMSRAAVQRMGVAWMSAVNQGSYFADGGLVGPPSGGLAAIVNYHLTVQAGVGDPVEIGREVVGAIRAYERAGGRR